MPVTIKIKETGELKVLKLVDPNTQVDRAADFLGKAGAFDPSSEFHELEENGAHFLVNQDRYESWRDLIANENILWTRLKDLVQTHGAPAVDHVLDGLGRYDLKDRYHIVSEALDKAFGVQE